MTKFHIFFSGPIEQESIIQLNDFIELLTKFCYVPRVQAQKFTNINWHDGITLELPKNFRVEYGTGPHHLHPTNLYYRDVLIAENIGRIQTEIHLDNLRMVTSHHLRRQPMSEKESKDIKDRMTALMHQKALDKASKKFRKHLYVEAGDIQSSYVSATLALGGSSGAKVADVQDLESQMFLPDNNMDDDEYKYAAYEYVPRYAASDSDDYDDCDQALSPSIK